MTTVTDYCNLVAEVRFASSLGSQISRIAVNGEIYEVMNREYNELLELRRKFVADNDSRSINEVNGLISSLVKDMDCRPEEGARLQWNSQKNKREEA